MRVLERVTFNTPGITFKGLDIPELQDIVQQCLVYIDKRITMENSTEGFDAKTIFLYCLSTHE